MPAYIRNDAHGLVFGALDVSSIVIAGQVLLAAKIVAARATTNPVNARMVTIFFVVFILILSM